MPYFFLHPRVWSLSSGWKGEASSLDAVCGVFRLPRKYVWNKRHSVDKMAIVPNVGTGVPTRPYGVHEV